MTTVPVRAVYALLDSAGLPIPETALCSRCIHDGGQKSAAIDAGTEPGEKRNIQFADVGEDLPCYICGAEHCAAYFMDGSCIHSDHTP